MPSQAANEIIRCIQTIINRELTFEQRLACEEIVLNVYPGAACRFIKNWAKNLSKKHNKVMVFDHFYVPIMNGIIVGASKRPRDKMFRFDTATKKMMYGAMHAYLGTNFSMKELEDIVWFTQFTTMAELQTAINVAQHHGVVNCAYVRAIIVGNRRKAAALLRLQDARFKKITEDPPNVLIGVPNVKSLQDAWTKRLKYAADASEESEVERNANKKL